MPLHIIRDRRPIDHDQQLRQAAEPFVRQRAIGFNAFLVQVRIGQQPIHAFDAVSQVGVAGGAERQCAQR